MPEASHISGPSHGSQKEGWKTQRIGLHKRNNAKVSEIRVGDSVLFKQPNDDKLTRYYRPVLYQVTKKKGSMVTVTHDGHTITRNSSHLKRLSSCCDEDR